MIEAKTNFFQEQQCTEALTHMMKFADPEDANALAKTCRFAYSSYQKALDECCYHAFRDRACEAYNKYQSALKNPAQAADIEKLRQNADQCQFEYRKFHAMLEKGRPILKLFPQLTDYFSLPVVMMTEEFEETLSTTMLDQHHFSVNPYPSSAVRLRAEDSSLGEMLQIVIMKTDDQGQEYFAVFNIGEEGYSCLHREGEVSIQANEVVKGKKAFSVAAKFLRGEVEDAYSLARQGVREADVVEG